MSFKELIDEFLIKQNENLEYFSCPICKENVKYLKIHGRKNHSVWIGTKNSIKDRKIISSYNYYIYYENKKKDYIFIFYEDKLILRYKGKDLIFNYDDFEDLDTNKIFNKIKDNLLFM